MPDINFKEISLVELFKNNRGNSLYTKDYCNNHKGEYEVFTGTTIGSFGFIDTYNYDLSNLTYTTDGEYAGTVSILTGKYNVGGHRALLKPIVDNLWLEYFSFILEPIFKSITKDGSVPSITWNIIKNRKVPLPVKEDGSYDLDVQKEIADKYKVLEEQKNKLIENKKILEETLIEIDSDNEIVFDKVPLTKIFDLSQSSNGSDFTKSFIKNNSGNIPVYGASKFEVEVGYGYVKDNAEILKKTKNGNTVIAEVKYFEDCLTYNIDGTAGYIYFRSGRFSLSEKVKPLVIFDEHKDALDTTYLRYTMQPIFRKNRKGREGHNGQNEFTKLPTNILKTASILIPIKIDGSYDLEAQKEIANRYKKIEEIKKGICDKIDKLINIKMLLD